MNIFSDPAILQVGWIVIVIILIIQLFPRFRQRIETYRNAIDKTITIFVWITCGLGCCIAMLNIWLAKTLYFGGLTIHFLYAIMRQLRADKWGDKWQGNPVLTSVYALLSIFVTLI